MCCASAEPRPALSSLIEVDRNQISMPCAPFCFKRRSRRRCREQNSLDECQCRKSRREGGKEKDKKSERTKQIRSLIPISYSRSPFSQSSNPFCVSMHDQDSRAHHSPLLPLLSCNVPPPFPETIEHRSSAFKICAALMFLQNPFSLPAILAKQNHAQTPNPQSYRLLPVRIAQNCR